jgi:hypothetical protein
LGIGDVRISPFMQIEAGDMAVSFLLFTSLRLGQRAQIYTTPLGIRNPLIPEMGLEDAEFDNAYSLVIAGVDVQVNTLIRFCM